MGTLSNRTVDANLGSQAWPLPNLPELQATEGGPWDCACSAIAGTGVERGPALQATSAPSTKCQLSYSFPRTLLAAGSSLVPVWNLGDVDRLSGGHVGDHHHLLQVGKPWEERRKLEVARQTCGCRRLWPQGRPPGSALAASEGPGLPHCCHRHTPPGTATHLEPPAAASPCGCAPCHCRQRPPRRTRASAGSARTGPARPESRKRDSPRHARPSGHPAADGRGPNQGRPAS